MGTTIEKLPYYCPNAPPKRARPFLRFPLFAAVATVFSLGVLNVTFEWQDTKLAKLPVNAAEILQKCSLLDAQPGPPHDFHLRTQSDRFQEGTHPTLIRNATIWTGRVSGHEIVVGDLLLEKGIIKAVGDIDQSALDVMTI